MRLTRLAPLVFFALACPAAVSAQYSCNGTCEPSTSSPTYAQTVQARPSPPNARGADTPLVFNVGPVNVGSTSYNYATPILYLPGRNGLSVGLTLYYNSRVWTFDQWGNATFNADRDFPDYGFRLGFGYLERFGSEQNWQYILTEPDGTKRQLRLKSGATDVYETYDSSFIDYNSTTKILRRKNGTQWLYEPGPTANIYRPKQIMDTNGNYISISYMSGEGVKDQAIYQIVDTLGRTITFHYDENHKLTSIEGPAFGGGTKTYATFTWSQRALNYSFASTIHVSDTVPSGTQINVLTACTYPNGTGYNFVYGDWGIVTKIEQKGSNGTVRSYVSYDYPDTSSPLSEHPRFTQQVVSKDGTSTAAWSQSFTMVSGIVSSYTVTDPLGTSTTTNLYTYGYFFGLVSSLVTKNSSGTTLRTASNEWGWGGSVGDNVRIIGVTNTLNDASPALQSKVEFSYTTNGNVSEVREYDFGLVLVRKTQTDYLTTGNYPNLHILGLPTAVRIYDGAGTLKTKTTFAYDGGNPQSVTPIQWTDPGTAARGNLTSITRYATPPNDGAQIRTFDYDSAGNARRGDVDCCKSEQWTYTSATQFAYLESTSHGQSGGTQLTSTRAYDLSTGLVTSVADFNQKTTTFEYDVMNRVTRVTGPDQVSTTTTYDDTSVSPVVTSTAPIDPGKSLVQVVTSDGLGRTVKGEVKDGASTTYSIVETQYDLAGRVIKVSNPYAPGQSVLWSETQYDALGRPTKIIPPDGSAQSNNTTFTYTGERVTVTDPAGKQRRTYSDALGRVIRVDEPGYDDGTPATGSVTVTGGPDRCLEYEGPTCSLWDTGTVWVTVDTFTATAFYGRTSTASGIAAALRTVFNTDPNSPVTAGGTGATIALTAKLGGSFTNYYRLAGGSTSDYPSGGSFGVNASGTTLAGGTDGNGANGHPPSLTTPLPTVYTYNVFDSLTVLTQGVQQRTFSYDGLGRLTSATTPEAGAVNYQYNAYNKVSQRTDSRGVITTYGYDALNRLNQVSYNVGGAPGVAATSTVQYFYDEGGSSANALGRLTRVTDGTGGETYQYNQVGQMTQFTKTVGATGYVIAYSYNQAGQLNTITYPSNRQVTQDHDPIGRLTKISSGGTDYVSSVQYNAAGAATQFNYGNGVAASIGYSPEQLQLTSLSYAKSGQTLFSLNYWYKYDATNCTTGATGNNGQIQCITDNVDSGRTVRYTYDAWARLRTAQTTGSTQYPSWSQSWDYDRFGNRKKQNGNDIVELTINTSTNRATEIGGIAMLYDAAGNLTKDDVQRFVYDAESHLTKLRNITDTADLAEYKLDGAGIRVKKCAPNCTSPTSSTVYIRSGSQVIAEYDNGAAVGSPTREYIYSGGQMVAKVEGGVTTYYHTDHLSARVTSDVNGTKVGEQGHYPFGSPWYESGANTKFKFTSYEREVGAQLAGDLDYAMFRYYYPRLGRFTSPDPATGSIIDPQSLNRYVYSRNDPINLTDPLGLLSSGTGILGLGCAAGKSPFLAKDDKIPGGDGWDTSWWWSFFDPANPVGVQQVLDFGGTMAAASARGALGDRWYDLPGNDDPVARAEGGWYADMVEQGRQNLERAENEKRFKECQSKSENWNIQKNLTLDGYLGAVAAATDAGIRPDEVLTIWDLEQSLEDKFGPLGAAGETGPMQVTSVTQTELRQNGLLPPGFDSNRDANLLAGARNYARNVNHYGVPRSSAAGAYRKGHKKYSTPTGKKYQAQFDKRNPLFASFVKCMEGKK